MTAQNTAKDWPRLIYFLSQNTLSLIGVGLRYYRMNYPEIYNTKRVLVEQAANTVADIYLRNVFPEMKVN
ncbi:MAG: hypothetical protein WB607_00720 [Candidatus Acidiferrum sp.]|jgi:hypothetical protein